MAQHEFTRRRYPHHLAIGGDDWLIRYKSGRDIARVSLDERTTPPRWVWVTWTGHNAKGTTDTLEAALQAVKDAILTLPPEKRVRPMTPGDRARRDMRMLRHSK